MVRTGRNTDTSSTPPPKRSRASASSSTSALKTIIAERDVDMNDTSHPVLVDLCEFIRAQYLTDLATKLCRYHEPTVRAFYDNFPEVESVTRPPLEVPIKVHGKVVYLSQEIIESHLNLPQVSEYYTTSYFSSLQDYTWQSLTATTYLEPPTTKTKAIYCGKFKEPYGVFWQFVRNNIIPTAQHSEVPQASCKLLVRMVADDLHIPFGALIYRSILGSASGGASSKLTFPCLISSLCTSARVPHMDKGPWKAGFGTLNAVNVGKSGTQRDIAVGDHPIPPPPPPPSSSSFPTSDPTPSSTSYPPPPTFDLSGCDPQMVGLFQHFHTQTTHHMDMGFHQIHNRLDLMDTQFGHINERFDATTAQYTHMCDMFEQLSFWQRSGGASGSGGGTQGGGNEEQGGPSDGS